MYHFRFIVRAVKDKTEMFLANHGWTDDSGKAKEFFFRQDAEKHALHVRSNDGFNYSVLVVNK